MQTLENFEKGEVIEYPKLSKTVASPSFSMVKCSCASYLKTNTCPHTAAVLIIAKKIEIPPAAKSTILTPNRKRGRVSKAKKALEKQ